MIRHILLIKFKRSALHSDIDRIKLLFLQIPKKIEGIHSVEWGINDSPEGKNQNFTHSVVMSFDSDQARQHYLPHPEHESLKAIFSPLIDDIIVFDYPVEFVANA